MCASNDEVMICFIAGEHSNSDPPGTQRSSAIMEIALAM